MIAKVWLQEGEKEGEKEESRSNETQRVGRKEVVELRSLER